MTIPLVFHRTAEAEYDAAVAWYERQQPGLGDVLAAEVQRVLDAIARQPGRYPVAERDIREAPVVRFPYCVYYKVRVRRIEVIAVFHTARDPAQWQSRA